MKQKILISVVCGIVLSACGNTGSEASGGGGGVPSNGTSSVLALANPLTIDNTGVIPAFSDAGVSTNTYVHNNSNTPITATVVYKLNVPGAANKPPVAISLPAGGVANLPISIPQLSNNVHKGSGLITLSYTYKNKAYTFNQIVNFEEYSTQSAGVFLSSGAISSNFGNATGSYTTIYVYGSGESGYYKINKLNTDPVLGNIIQGKAGNIVTHQVQSFELYSEGIGGDHTGNVTVSYTDKNNQAGTSPVKQVRLVGTDTSSSQAIIIPSLTPNIDTKSGNTGSAYIYNGGNGVANVGTPSGSGGISGTTLNCGSDSPVSLPVGHGCTINFSVTGNSGNGSIQVPYNSGKTASIGVTWYDSNSATGQLGIDTDADAGLLLSTAGTGTIHTSIYNIGSVVVNNVTATTPVSDISVSINSGNKCTNVTLQPGNVESSVCDYYVSVNDSNQSKNGFISLGASGTSGGNPNVSAQSKVQYIASGNSAAAFVVNNDGHMQDKNPIANKPALTIVGDNTTSDTTTVEIDNMGDTNAAGVTVGLDTSQANGANVSISNDQCTSELDSLDYCLVTIKLGPQTLTNGPLLNGSIRLRVAANGVPVTYSLPIGVTVQPTNQQITLQSVTPANSSGGDGKTENSAIEFKGGNETAVNSYVTFTYKNTSTGAGAKDITLTDINIGPNLNNIWQVVNDGNDATNCENRRTYTGEPFNYVLHPGDTCNIKLINSIATVGDTQPQTNLDIPFPRFTVTNGGMDTKTIQPGLSGFGNSKYYVTNYQAVITYIDFVRPTDNPPYIQTEVFVSGYADGGYPSGTKLSTQLFPGEDLLQPQQTVSGCTFKAATSQFESSVVGIEEDCDLSQAIEGGNLNFVTQYPINYSLIGVSHAEEVNINYSTTFTTGPLVISGDILNCQTYQFKNACLTYTESNNYSSNTLEVPAWQTPPVVWMTYKTYNGNLGGYAGADAKCNDQSDKYFPAGYQNVHFKAMLYGNRAVAPGTTYYTAATARKIITTTPTESAGGPFTRLDFLTWYPYQPESIPLPFSSLRAFRSPIVDATTHMYDNAAGLTFYWSGLMYNNPQGSILEGISPMGFSGGWYAPLNIRSTAAQGGPDTNCINALTWTPAQPVNSWSYSEGPNNFGSAGGVGSATAITYEYMTSADPAFISAPNGTYYGIGWCNSMQSLVCIAQ